MERPGDPGRAAQQLADRFRVRPDSGDGDEVAVQVEGAVIGEHIDGPPHLPEVVERLPHAHEDNRDGRRKIFLPDHPQTMEHLSPPELVFVEDQERRG
eukprot:540560-Hanusia_phi.AAC.2